MRKVVLVGAGNISQTHAEVLRSIPGVMLHGVVDRHEGAAKALAEKWAIARVYSSAEEAIRFGEIDTAHVLTPPPAHVSSALPFLEVGIPTLIEKPLATSRSECSSLVEAAARSSTILGVNQNFVHHPAFLRLRRVLAERRLGRARSVQCIYNMPLRQMTVRQFGHWMFTAPVNILLEQVVHPLSHIAIIAGPIEETIAVPGAPIELSPDTPVYPSFGLIVRCRRLPAEMHVSVGESFPFWQISVICDDGVAVADIVNNRFFTYQRTRWLDACDNLLSGATTAAAILTDSVRNAGQYLLSTTKTTARSDPFFCSMKGSISAFYEAVEKGKPPELDGAFGSDLVAACEQAAAATTMPNARPAPTPRNGPSDVLVLGGTGFIGKHVVKRLLAEGYRIAVMARNTQNLGPLFDDDRVAVLSGDARDPAAVEHAVGSVRIVVDLAHGGASGSYQEVRGAMLGAAETVARACLAHGTDRLLYASSIASLYLGPQNQAVTGSTPPDPLAHLRSDYARVKAECEQRLLSMHVTDGLPVYILRPGVVIGDGGIANHSALGFFNNEQHCIGWNAGRNPLPFVLAEDVAEAVCLTCKAPVGAGHCYNLVGDVRLTAREYVAELASTLDRPLRFHPKNQTVLWLQEMGKWLIKVMAGRKSPMPSRRDLLSRGLVATFDCSDTKRDLGWRPTCNRDDLIERGIRVHGPR